VTGPGGVLGLHDESDVVIARLRVRELAAHQGLSKVETEALATAVTEIARNVVVHAGGGSLVIAAAADGARRGVVVTVSDTGPGIADLALAMIDGFSTGGGLGSGLPGAGRLVDVLAVESTLGRGVTVTLTKWRTAVAR